MDIIDQNMLILIPAGEKQDENDKIDKRKGSQRSPKFCIVSTNKQLNWYLCYVYGNILNNIDRDVNNSVRFSLDSILKNRTKLNH